MKKLFKIFCMTAVLTLFTACGSAKESDTISGELPDLMDQIYDEVKPDMPERGTIEITDENLSYYTGAETLDYKEALACEPLMGSYPHSVVLVRLNPDADPEDAKNAIRENVDPRKWICVEVEKDNIIVDNIGDLVILIMDNDQP